MFHSRGFWASCRMSARDLFHRCSQSGRIVSAQTFLGAPRRRFASRGTLDRRSPPGWKHASVSWWFSARSKVEPRKSSWRRRIVASKSNQSQLPRRIKPPSATHAFRVVFFVVVVFAAFGTAPVTLVKSFDRRGTAPRQIRVRSEFLESVENHEKATPSK